MTKTHTIMFTIMITAILMIATSPLQNAYADLISTSPKNVITATGAVSWDHTWVDHSHFSHSSFLHFGSHHRGHCHWTLDPITTSSLFLTNDYELTIKSLKDYNINVASGSGLSGTTITLTDADGSTTTTLNIGDNPITPVSKGLATISITAQNLDTTQLTNAILVHSHFTGGIFNAFHGGHGSCNADHTHSDVTVSQDFTIEVTQPNAGGPKPRLAQDSDVNLLEFSTITQLFDLPAKTDFLTVTAAGATTSCEVFDQHGALRGICGAVIGLGSGDYSGFWKVEATAASGITKMSAVVDGNPVQLLTEITK